MKNFRGYFKEYCDRSTLQGFSYLGENRTLFERLWWLVILVVSVSTCGFCIYQVYNNWEQSPIMVNVANTGIPIYNIPFPAVTICPESRTDTKTKFSFTDIDQKLKENKKLKNFEFALYYYLMMTCQRPPRKPFPLNPTFGDLFFTLLYEARPTFYVENCHSLQELYDCRFVPIVTDEGLCYTFNIIHRDVIFRKNVLHHSNFHQTADNDTDWTLQDGYSDKVKERMYPYQAFQAGARNGLNFQIRTPHEDDDFACKDLVQGYKIVLDTPMNIPRPSQKFFMVPLDKSVAAAVQPVMVTTSKKVQNYDVNRRQCFFEDERPLKYFKKYTASNCRLECLTNLTLERCGCVNYFMPRENGTEICNTNYLKCLKEQEDAAYFSEVFRKMDTEILKSKENLVFCNCLPTCSDLSYEVETTVTSWEWEEQEDDLSFRSRKASVTIYFESDTIITMERNERYGLLDFVANFGGFLGLFMGFSILSLIEILYFLTVRVVANKYLHGLWTGPEN